MFSGGHRLIDAGIVGEENLAQVNKSAILGMGVATIVRIFLFLAVLGVVSLETNWTLQILQQMLSKLQREHLDIKYSVWYFWRLR